MSKVVTIGLPLPKWPPNRVDVSDVTRKSIDLMRKHSADHGVTTFEMKFHGIQIAHNHNELVKKVKGDWIVIIGSDHEFHPASLLKLLAATEEDPNIKLIMGVTPHRKMPFRPVAYNFDPTGERLLAIMPFRDFHPGEAEAGAVIKVDVVGSGFTLIHRDLLTTIPFPWFEFATQPVPRRYMEPILDWQKHLKMADAPRKDMAKYLKELSEASQRAKVRYRYPLTHGPDMNFCLKARDYGIQSYLHLGVVVRHHTFVGIGMEHYLEYMKQGPEMWEQEFFGGKPPTVEGVQEARSIVDKMREAEKRAQAEFEEEMRKRKQEAEEVPVA